MPFNRDPLFTKPSQLSKSIIHASESIGNPFFTIWFRPARTIREQLETGNHDPEVALAMLFGIAMNLTPFAYWAIPFEFSPLTYGMRLGIIGAAAGGILLYIIPAFLNWTGRWLGGDGEDFEARSVYGWSLLPCVVTLLPGMALLMWLGKFLYMPLPEWKQTAPLLHYGIATFHYLESAAYLWTAILIVAGQRETHHINWFKSALSLVLTLILVGVPCGLAILACRMVLGV